jgi:hypothetical protein
MRVIEDWDAQPVEAVQSRGGVWALADLRHNLLLPDDYLWPPAAILQKLYQSRQLVAFPEAAHEPLARLLGYYCDLQSLHSEDAITWSFFGTLSSVEQTTELSNWLLERLGLPWRNRRCRLELWRRIPHPDKPVSGGPELDFSLIGDQGVIFGEAKWLSREGQRQGVLRDKGQLQLRREFLERYAKRLFGVEHGVVLQVLLDPIAPSAMDGPPRSVESRAITWAALSEWPGHPLQEEFKRYYAWKLKFARRSIPLVLNVASPR